MLYNDVLVSAVQWSESAICIHISLPSWTSLLATPYHPSRSPQSTELSSLHYTVLFLFFLLIWRSSLYILHTNLFVLYINCMHQGHEDIHFSVSRSLMIYIHIYVYDPFQINFLIWCEEKVEVYFFPYEYSTAPF